VISRKNNFQLFAAMNSVHPQGKHTKSFVMADMKIEAIVSSCIIFSMGGL
jgi:hypothetical protein